MSTKARDYNLPSCLRQQAETLLSKETLDLSDYSPQTIGHLIYELRVHQAELQIQNQELQQAQFERELIYARYIDLYNLAPVGYVTLDEDGIILEANLTSAEMLGRTWDELLKQRLSHFVKLTDQDTFHFFFQKLTFTETMQQSAVRLVKPGGTHFYALLEGRIAKTDLAQDPKCQSRQYWVSISNITDRKLVELEMAQLLESVSTQRTQLRALTGQLAEAEEVTRKALARELHDWVGQKLTALSLNLSAVRAYLSHDQLEVSSIMTVIDQSVGLVEETTEAIQDVMVNLRSPVLDDYGLIASLKWLGSEMASRAGFVIKIEGREPEPRLAGPIEHALFRITQEALTNILKHSQASRVIITLAEEQKIIRLVIADDGQGFDPMHRLEPGERPKWGLLTMVERAEAVGGRCQIESQPGQGTQVIVEVTRCAT